MFLLYFLFCFLQYLTSDVALAVFIKRVSYFFKFYFLKYVFATTLGIPDEHVIGVDAIQPVTVVVSVEWTDCRASRSGTGIGCIPTSTTALPPETRRSAAFRGCDAELNRDAASRLASNIFQPL